MSTQKLLYLGLAVFSALELNAVISVDPKLGPYEKAQALSGNLNSVGSDTLNNLMTLWAEGFRKAHPGVTIGIEGKGSSTAPPALIQGVSQLGPMSREMKPKEIDDFEKRFGYKPTKVVVAVDAVAVYVHRDNPIDGLTMKELDGIFSSTFKRGGLQIRSWNQVGQPTKTLAARPISIYGRNSASGTYSYFKKVVLKGGDYANSVKEQPGSSAVVQSIAKERNGIGYSGIGYVTSGVRAVPLSVDGQKFFGPTQKDSMNQKYPLARALVVYVNKPPKGELDLLTAAFLRYVLSKEGQQIVAKDGYYPLDAKVVKKIRKQLAL